MVATTPLTLEQRQVLWACYAYWLTEPLPAEERTVCYKWVAGTFAERFGKSFHQSVLTRLAKSGYLVRANTRRQTGWYYRLANHHLIRQATAGLDQA